MSKPDVCTHIVKCLEDVWTDEMLFDFTVKVADETIQCHRLILAACSDFFKALFRSGMKEVTDNCVVLQDVTYDVFQLILRTVYTGANLLTLENVYEVWRAVHQLQIPFMIGLCENFVMESITIDTWEKIYTTAKHLYSEKVLKQLHIFMLKNFDQISLSPTFLQLSFDEVRDLIKSQDLVVMSEDLVLESVIRWVKYVPCDAVYSYNSTHSNPDEKRNILSTDTNMAQTNQGKMKECIENNKHDADKDVKPNMERKAELNDVGCDTLTEQMTENVCRVDKLSELLNLVRICLVSPAVLSRVYKMQIVSENKVLRDMMFNAFFYVQSFRHGQWSTSAVHRSCSEYINAGVFEQSNGEFFVLNAEEDKWYYKNISKCDFLQENIQLVCFDGELYAAGQQQNKPNEPSKLFVFCGNRWVELLTTPGQNLLLLSHKQFIYILNKDDNIIYKLNPKIKLPILEKFTNFQENVKVNHAMIFDNFLLIFCSDTQNGIDKTAVHKLDFLSKVWTRLDTLDGSAEHIISFRNDKHSYVLQSNGSLWCIVNSNTDTNIELKFVFKLSNSQNKLNGALTYNGKLFVLGNFLPNSSSVPSVPGHIAHIRRWISKVKSSNFIPIILQKSHLSAYKV